MELEEGETPPLREHSLDDHPEIRQAYEGFRPRWEAWSTEHRRGVGIVPTMVPFGGTSENSLTMPDAEGRAPQLPRRVASAARFRPPSGVAHLHKAAAPCPFLTPKQSAPQWLGRLQPYSDVWPPAAEGPL